MRIAIVNDMMMAAECLRRVVADHPGYEVAWMAKNGAEAIEKCLVDRPDLILMDMVMPVMGGAEATRQIMAQCPCPILVVTSSLDANAALVFETMGAGARDAVKTPVLSSSHGTTDVDEFLRKVDMLHRLSSYEAADELKSTQQLAANCSRPHRGNPLIVIGASSGGPNALETVISNLPQSIVAPVVVVQHIDANFSRELAQWLDKNCLIKVRLAEAGQRPRVGQVYIADAHKHLAIDEMGLFRYDEVEEWHAYQPSVDVFFESVASNWRGDVIAVMLTGMGRDGAKGMLGLHRAGHYTIAQNEASCAVFGMPKAAIEAGAVIDILPLDRVAPTLLAHLIEIGLRKAI
ncbi:MAG: chemotaxis-specific protein-glutamate methyltransferase CheB [Gammaproteobacteria bacterium]|nr:chemotaxis-specific protein-glutamate methyltransferase CheB [Gammaproteobacteria bacterium]